MDSGLKAPGRHHGPCHDVLENAAVKRLAITQPEQLSEDKLLALLQETFIAAAQGEQLHLLLRQGSQRLLLLAQSRFLLFQGLAEPGELRLTLGWREGLQGDRQIAYARRSTAIKIIQLFFEIEFLNRERF